MANRCVFAVKIAVLSATCWVLATTVAQSTASATNGLHRYTVNVSDSANQLTVRVELNKKQSYVRLGSRQAARQVSRLRHCDSDTSLSFFGGRIDEPVKCFEYSVRLKRSSNEWSSRSRRTYTKDFVTSPDSWLILPPDTDTDLHVTFNLPDSINVSVPWEHLGSNEYRFRRDSLSSTAITAFGRFKKHIVQVPGGELRVSIMRTGDKVHAEKIITWLKAAADNVATAHGKFPLKTTQIIVVPVNDRSGEAVPFGRVIRDGGEAVQFFVNTARPLDEFLSDWTATHEFSHLLLPFVDDRWVSEGFASYYQNVLMARGKVYSPQRAWQKLYEGFERGKAAAPGTSPHSATMRNGLMKVYWSGAAVALIADVKLRELSNGEESLDTVMRKLRYCCLPSRKVYSDAQFFRQMDKLTSYDIFEDLYNEYAHAGSFPNIEPVFSTLGLSVSRSKVKLVSGKHDEIRDAIMQAAPVEGM